MRTTGHLLWHRATTRPDAAAARSVRCANGSDGGLLAWYRQHGRTLPWRETRDPYRILVSEVMLQQTQVDRVLPKYHEWLDRYPVVRGARCERRERDVVKTWYPLGYNIRPRRLHAIAREAVDSYGGQLPDDEETLRVVQGHRRVHGRRGDELRVRQARGDSRHERGARAVAGVRRRRARRRLTRARTHLWTLSRAVLPHRHVYDFNQALMDFGATVCTARSPRCQPCPMRSKCRTYPFSGVDSASERGRRGERRRIHIRRGRRRRRHRARRDGCWSRGVSRALTWRDSGSFPAANANRARPTTPAWRASSPKNSACTSTIGSELLVTEHAYPERTVRLHFRHATIAGEPQPLLGQELMWIARRIFDRSTFPEADRELIELLSGD